MSTKGLPKPEGSGRAKGTPNKKTLAARAIFEEMKYDPLRSMISEAKKLHAKGAKRTSEGSRRLDRLNKEIIPYLHPKLSTVEHVGEGGGPLSITINYGD